MIREDFARMSLETMNNYGGQSAWGKDRNWRYEQQRNEQTMSNTTSQGTVRRGKR